jgi:hypothetical protein
VTKQIRVKMSNNNSASPTYHYVGITVRPCKLNASGISTMYTPIGSKLEITFSAHTFTYGENSTGICGTPVYQLVGGNNAYLTFDVGARKLTFFPKTTAYQNTYTHTIKSWCSNFPLNFTNYNFNVVGQAPCSISNYVADRKNIKVMPLLEKYDIGADGNDDFPFAFNHTPSNCNYYKIYTSSAVRKLNNAAISTPWMSIIWSNTSPYLRVNTANVGYENHIVVTVRAKLYAESSYDPFITFEIYLHPHPCIKATLSGSNPLQLLNTASPFAANPHSYNIAYQQVAQNREFVHFTASVGNCTPLKYSLTTPNAQVLALLRPGGSGSTLISTSPMAFTQTGPKANL